MYSKLGIMASICCPLVIILILIGSVGFAQSDASKNESSPVFYLNSSVPLTWYNNDSIKIMTPADGSKVRVVLLRQQSISFVCGFYCVEACNSYLFSIVAVGGGNSSVVWSANRNYPVKENATLQLTVDGGLVLQDSDGTQVWSTNGSGNSILGMNLTEAGNLVLLGNKGALAWQSFDHPSDVLLVRQCLNEGQTLIASSSGDIWNQGQYYATLTSDAGFAVFIDADQAKLLMYYKLVPDNRSSNSTGLNYAELQQHGFLVNLGTSQVTSGRNSYEHSAQSDVKYMRLDFDGHLRIYQHSDTTGLRVIVDLITEDLGDCQYPLRCGEYGVCKADQYCSCPEGEDGVQYFQTDHGCSRITPLSCEPSLHHLLEVKNATYFNTIDSDAAYPGIKDMDMCKQACLQNCSCGGAFFRYENNVSDGYCFMPSKILSIREGHIPNYNFTSATFIKVQINFVAPSLVPAAKTTRENFPPTPSSGDGANIAAIVVGASIVPLITFCLVVVTILATLRRTSTVEEGEDYTIDQVPGMPVKFLYEDLRVATEDFKERVGSGGFGSVFKGLLADGTRIAVKRLDRIEQGMREFLAEVKTIGSLHHFNLVRLIGFCAEKSNRLLVFEYMCNGSLDNWIFYGCQRPCLDWETRKRIILDIAKGLAYLHEECRHRIVHLDIKPQNILLDENFNAKVSDFGLSELIGRDESQVFTTMRGTPGYLAPEWSQPKVTVKVDIYSFGIVLLEIVTGRRNVDCTREESNSQMLRVLQKKAEEERLIEIVENLEEMKDHGEVVRMIRIGAWCLQDDPTRRPPMSVVVKVLEGVMEVDSNIIYKFIHAMTSTSPSDDKVCTEPEASVLSNPR
ncbi:G-type lectin S-receptor-like serine/threonine-protein kinase SD2-5 [Vitis vinifera]|nr:G-type lectin S-receptor-like serine/threonine-protein kinase SD2-5 [Vitis vinifera]|eukprot:XP_002277406.2 PREDICTED: G-type lectin S-receptor-like serine/threonine-protein kinase SD2-5 isoform X1 [Vitis vinifera]